MKNPRRPRPERLVLCLSLLAALPGVAALVPTEWRYRQALEVPAPGLVEVALPPATFDAAQPGLTDLRLLDPAGREIPYVIERGRNGVSPLAPKRSQPVNSFTVTSGPDSTTLLIQPGPAGPLAALELATRAPFFLKGAHVDISANGLDWESLGPAMPLFRQFGAEQLQLPLNGRKAAFVRVTLDDFRSRPVDFSGARVLVSPERAALPAPPTITVDATIRQREEFAGETVLTVTLPGARLPLAAFSFEATDPLFTRRVHVTVREFNGDQPGERAIANGTLYRVALEGNETRAQLDVPADLLAPAGELLIHIDNGDSPPLAITAVRAKLFPEGLRFLAATAGTHLLLTGNPQRGAARYDIAAFAEQLRGTNAVRLAPGAIEETPGYRPSETLAAPPLPEIPLAGAPLDSRDWTTRRSVHLDNAGVHELELDPAALSGARADFADLRLVHAGNQIPYLLERTALSRSLALKLELVPDKARPNVSRWRVQLPHAGLPVNRVALTTSTPLFSREFQLYELVPDVNGTMQPLPVGSTRWDRTPEPGSPATRGIPLPNRLRTDTLWIETPNGDNPAIALDTLRATYPVVRLVFKTVGTADFALLYGNPSVPAAYYDLSMVATRLLTAPRAVARLDEVPPANAKAPRFEGKVSVFVFWGALALVVVVLLAVVARLLPKADVN